MDLLPWAYQGFGLAVAETMEGRWGEYRERAQVEVLVRGARGHMMPGVLMQIAIMLALGSGVVRAVGPAAAGLEAGVPEVQAHGNDEAGLKPRYVAVVGFKTLSSGGDDESWMGVGLGEELATRLSMAGNAIKTIERLQLSEILAPCAVLPGVPPAQTVPHMVIGDENPELDKACAAALRQAKTSGTLYSADALIVGTLLCDGQFLSATTRLVDVETGAVQWGVTARVPGSRGSVEAVRSLAATLTERWCDKLNVPVLSEMRDVGVEKASVYQALWQARQSLYDGRYEQCLETIAWAEAQTPGLEQLEGLMATRDDAWGQQLERVGPDELQVQGIIAQMLQSAQRTKDYYKQGHAMSCYYMGRAYEKAGSLAEAEAEYRECLEQRPSRLLWAFEASGSIDTPTVVGGIAYAGSQDGHVRAFNARSGQVLWDFTGTEAVHVRRVSDGVVYGQGGTHLWALEAAHGSVLWSFDDASIADDGPCALANGVVYVGTARWALAGTAMAGSLCALDAETGEQKWTFDTSAGVSSPLVIGGTVYVGSDDGYVRALDADKGKLRWEAQLEGDPDAHLRLLADEASPEIIYAFVRHPLRLGEANGNDHIYVLRACDGRRLCEADMDESALPPKTTKDHVYLSDGGNCLRAIDIHTGGVSWALEASGEVRVLAAGDGMVWIAAPDYGVHALREQDGALAWKTPAISFMPSLVVSSGVVYVSLLDGKQLHALRAIDGKSLWLADTNLDSAASIIVAGGIVYLQSWGGMVALDAITGKHLWGQEGLEFVFELALTEDVLYVGSSQGHMRAFRTQLPPGPDYVERATTGLMSCLSARGNEEEAARFAARLFHQTEQRSGQLRGAYPAASVPQTGTDRTTLYGLRAVLGKQGISSIPGPALWSFDAGDEISRVRVANGRAYISTEGDGLIALNITNRQELWRYKPFNRIDSIKTIGNTVYIHENRDSGSGCVYALEARTGQQLWRAESAYNVEGGDGDVVIIGGLDDHLHALDAQSGRALWGFGADCSGFLGVPILLDGTVFVNEYLWGKGPRHLWALDSQTGKQRWTMEFAGHVIPPCVSDKRLYVAEGATGHLCALDIDSGKPIWETHSGVSHYSICASGNAVYISSIDTTAWDGLVVDFGPLRDVSAYDAATGKLLWSTDVPLHHQADIQVIDGVVYADSPEDEYLCALDVRDGSILWTLKKARGFDPVEVADGIVCAQHTSGTCSVVDARSGAVLWDADENCTLGDGILLVADGDKLHAVALASLRSLGPQGFVWANRPQFWSYIIWGKGGLAISKIRDNYPLAQIIKHDNWPSADALAAEIDRLVSLRDWSDPAVTARGNWDGPKAMGQDPSLLCPPGVTISAALAAQGIRPAAQLYLQVAQQTDDPDGRREYAAEAVRLAPRFAKAREVLADYYVQRGTHRLAAHAHEDAIADFNAAIDVAPNCYEAHLGRGDCCRDLALYEQATSNYTRVIEIHPACAEARCRLGDMLCVLGRYAQAETSCQEALRLDPRDPEAHAMLGVVHALQGSYGAATDCSRKAMQLLMFPDRSPAYMALGDSASSRRVRQVRRIAALLDLCSALVAEGTGDRSTAIECFDAYLKAEPNGAYAPEARRRLEALR